MNRKQYTKEMLAEVPIFNCDTTELNETIAEHLQQNEMLSLPENVDLIKTSCAKQMPPSDKNWYYKRAASVFRSIILTSISNYTHGIGTGFFAKKFKARKNRGVRPSKMVNGSTGHIKAILENLVQVGWIRKHEMGYVATDNGINVMKEFINKISE